MPQTSVLIVEDEVMIALETSEVIKELGYHVVGIVKSGEEAIAQAEAALPDIILMDIHLAGQINGIEAADTIRSSLNIPIIFLTAHAENKFLEEAKKVLPCGYLVKPVQERDLKVTIEMALYAAKIETDRRHAEEALRQSQQRYLDLVESANTIIMKWDTTGYITFLNRFAQDFFGFQEEEILGKNLIGLIVPKLESSGRDPSLMLQKILKTPEAYLVTETENIKKDGSRIWISWSNKGIRDHQGNLLEMLSMGHDVTKQKLAQEKLANRTSMLQVVLDSIEESALLLDPKGDILFGNQTFAERMKRPLPQLIGTNIEQVLTRELSEARMKAVHYVITTGKSSVFKESREQLHFENFVYPVLNSEGDILGASMLSVDITERIAADMHLQKLQLAIEQSPVSIIITDSKGIIEYTNPGFTANTGYEKEEVLEHNLLELEPGKDKDKTYQSIWDSITSGQNWRGEIEFKTKNGEHAWGQLSISPVVNDLGQIAHFIAIMEDITKRKELEHLKEDIDGIMRHDLRTPLTAIVGYPPMLLNTDLTDRQKVQIRNIASSGKRMLQIIDSYLDLSKIETGTYSPVPKSLNLNNILTQVLNTLEALFHLKEIVPDVLLNQTSLKDSEPVHVQGETAIYYTILENLIKNAIEASPPREKVQIEVTSRQEKIEIVISNQGAVPELIRDQFFDKYISYGKTKGTGFGTYSAKLLTESQGGTITMQTSEKEGTKITLRLPA